MHDCQVTADPKWIAPWALDEKGAEKCWQLREELVEAPERTLERSVGMNFVVVELVNELEVFCHVLVFVAV